MRVPKKNCHPDRSEAKWRDLLLILGVFKNPDGSVALSLSSRPQPRDLRFRGPFLGMFNFLVNVELLRMQGGIALDNDRLAAHFFELIQPPRVV